MDQLKRLEANEFFDLIDKLVKDGKVELLSSAKYHPILPIVPEKVLTPEASVLIVLSF